ncbi:MAG TPA: BTAD domain-containing putative transcriptional regulator [Streptosporangiaceae bacterium]|jgi:DNA-binding SARP family transcriptional activator
MANDDTGAGGQLRVGVLGPVRAWLADRELPPGPPRQQALLGMLAMRANRVVSRDELVDALWGQRAPASAEGGVHTYVAGLRRVLEPGRSRRGPSQVLASAPGGYVLRLDADRVDAIVFERGLAAGRRLRGSGDLNGAIASLDAALGEWHGSAFAGVPGPFATAERVRLAELRSAAAEERADVLLELGRHEQAVPELASLVAEHPLRERMRGLLMVALYRCGRQAEALQAFHDARQVLADELGIDPGPELSRIHQQILALDPRLEAPGRGAPAGPVTATALPLPPPAARLAVTDPVPAQLPLEAPGFSGRHNELERMLRVIGTDPAPDPALGVPDGPPVNDTVQIIAITGTAGVGKTALANRFARQVARRFPDGQLYVNLRGFDPSGSAMSPESALRFFLDALAVPPQRMPVDVEGRAALFRSMLDGKRVLVVLDNARDPDQVRPLLPGSPGSLVVVTSRSQLTGLVVAEGATPLTLDVLTEEEAHELLGRRLGPEVVAAEPAAAAELVSLCARLPLALGVAAGRAATRPGFSLAALAAELRDTRNRLEVLDAGDAATDVRAVLSWSYEQLSPSAARMFRLLGLHPGPDVSLPAAASLAGVSRSEAASALRELTRVHALAEHVPGRFAFHDLLRAYAVDRAETIDSEADRTAAERRCSDHYLHTAHAGALQSNSLRKALDLDPLTPGAVPEEFSGRGQALAWFEAENPVMLGLLTKAIADGDDQYAWQITWTLAPFFYRRGRWHECITIQRQALQAAQRLRDPVGLGHAHYELGRGLVLTGDFAEAEPHLSTALDIFGRLGDRANEATVHQGFGALFEHQGRYAQALVHAREAMRVVEEIGPASTLAGLENSVGWLYAHLGQYEKALVYCQRSLEFQREIGYRGGEADTLDSLGYTHSRMNAHQQAADCYAQAVDIYREIGDRYHEAGSHLGLGDAQLQAVGAAAAAESWRQALDILESIPHEDAGLARRRLASLPADSLRPVPGTV